MTVSLRGLPACNTEACGYRDLRTILLSWSGSHRAASIWRTRRARGIAALARVEATVYGIGGTPALPLAKRQPCKGEEPVTRLLEAVSDRLAFGRHLRMKARRRCSTSAAEVA